MEPELSELVGTNVLSIGADVVEIDRIRRITTERPRFVDRVYTEGEQAYCRRAIDPAERFAARFAAKEAVMKALGVGLGGTDFVEIEVTKLESGQPVLALHGRAARRAEELGIGGWLLTLSHSDTVALAIAVAQPPAPSAL